MTDIADEGLAIDADGHVHEADLMFSEHLAPGFRARTRGWALNGDRNRRFIVDGIEHPPFPKEISVRKPMAAPDRLKVLDKEGIAAAVLYPSAALVAGYLDAGMAFAVAEAYQDWMEDYVATDPRRLFYAAPVPLHDIDRAVALAERGVNKKRAIAVCVRPNPVDGRRLDDPGRAPLFEAVSALGVPLVIHESTGCPETAGGDRYGGMMDPASYAYNHVISHPFEQMMASTALICGGVLERFPALRVGFMEAGCSWVPYWLARLDEHLENRKLRPYYGRLTMSAREYFARQCVVSCDPDDETIALAVAGLGADRIVFATDYPHFDSEGGAVAAFRAAADIGPADQRRLLRDNAIEFYRLPFGARS